MKKKERRLVPMLGHVALSLVIACSLGSCSDDSGSDGGHDIGKGGEAGAEAVAYTVKAANASRVHNYSNQGKKKTRSSSSWTMPNQPAIPADAIDLTVQDEWGNYVNYNWGTLDPSKTYYVPAGKEFTGGVSTTVTIYVAGTLHTGNGSGTVTYYVLDGGTLDLAGASGAINNNSVVYCWGELANTNMNDWMPNFSVAGGSSLYMVGDLVFNTVAIAGNLYCKGSVLANEVCVQGTVYACSIKATTKLYDENSGASINTGYIETPLLSAHSSTITIDDNGLINVEEIALSNADTRFFVDGRKALIKAERLTTNNVTWPREQIAKEFYCKIDGIYVNGNQCENAELELQNGSAFAEEYAWVPATGCSPGYGTPTEDDQPDVNVVKVTDIDPLGSDHDHGVLSATCITSHDGTFYATYHTRGTGIEGCIETWTASGEAISLGNYMWADGYDFNHLIVDANANGGKKIVTVGNETKKGAFIGTLPVSFASAVGTASDFAVKEVVSNVHNGLSGDASDYNNAGDANCVVRQGDYYYVTTYAGYGPVSYDNLSRVRTSDTDKTPVFVKTNGSAKHITLANGKAAVLSLDTYSDTESTATVTVYADATDHTFGARPEAVYSNLGPIKPVDGKNVLAVDGNDIYACLSQGGLMRLTDNKTWQRGANVPVNGLAIDANYLYVANGSFLSVLDKATMTEVAYYHAASNKSANYIHLENGLIYVSYGEDGIQVFKLVTK